jgi:hypothetical protein
LIDEDGLYSLDKLDGDDEGDRDNILEDDKAGTSEFDEESRSARMFQLKRSARLNKQEWGLPECNHCIKDIILRRIDAFFV